MPPHLADLLKDVLGPDYRVERELEGGGMSRVFLATDVRHDRPVVVKVLPPELVSAQSAQRFKREIEITARLQHPHILPIITSGTWADGAYFITPFISGESLRARLEREKKLPLDDIVKILGDVGSAVAYAHGRGIIHRDIKPGNILFADGESILADFGIARIVSTEATPITTTGVILGTPSYMAPEMVTHEAADVYSLGVVACEMLTGALPTRGMSAREIIDARGTVPGDSRWRVAAVAAVIAHAISPSLATRTATAIDLLHGLERARKRWNARSYGIAGSIALVAVLALGGIRLLRGTPVELSSAKFAVTSIGGAEASTVDAVNGIEERFSDWRDVKASNLALGDTGNVAHVVSIREAVTAARRLGARNLVLVDARVEGDSVSIGVTLYDAAGDSALRARRAMVGMSSAGRVMPYRRLINSLLREDDPLPWRSAADRAQASLAAWEKYDAGRRAVRAWRLDVAEHAFRDAVDADDGIGVAHLWLAQTLTWSDTAERNESRAEAMRAKAAGSTLSARDSLQADGLIDLGSGDWPAACAAFRSIVRSDSSDFAAWIGIGDCQARDHAVLASNRTWTGFAFRGSFEDASRAYRRASDIGGTFASSAFRGWLLERMQRVLVPATNRVRSGALVERKAAFMFARPYLDKDTVAYAPYSYALAATLKSDPPHDLLLAAVTHNREVIRTFIEDWVQRSPGDVAAIDSLAIWSELAGGFAKLDGRRVTSRELLHRARNMVTDSTEQVRLAAAEVRDLLRHSDFVEVQRKSDSLYRAGATRRFPDLPEMAGLAALLGHLRETVRLLPFQPDHFKVPLANGSAWAPPLPILEAAASLETYASFGVPRDSVRALARRTAELIRSFVPSVTQADLIRSDLVAAPLSYVAPRESLLPGFRLQPPDEATRAVLALAVGDTTAARQQLTRDRDLQRLRMPGDGLGFAYRIATVELALGDTSAAIRSLDEIIETIPVLNNVILNEVPTVGALIRTFALRAGLARRMHDQTTAARNAEIVQALLKDSDPELAPLISEMRAIQRL